MGFQQYIALTILVPCILSMWPSQLSLCARMKFIMFLSILTLRSLNSANRSFLLWSTSIYCHLCVPPPSIYCKLR
jgi:hypothetical protein